MDHNATDNAQSPQNPNRSKYVTIPLFLLLCFAVLWLFIEVGRIKLSVPITTLSSRVEINSSNISSISSRVEYVGAIARNADMHAHSHGYSDIRLKRNVSQLNNALDNISNLRGVTFLWDTEKEQHNMNMPRGNQIGFIAQEVEEIYPELVTIGPNGFKQVDYDKVTPIMVEAIKEQQIQISNLQQQNAELEARIELLEKLLYDQAIP